MIIYNFLVCVAAFLSPILGLFSPKARLFLTGQRGISQKLKTIKKGPLIWFHCASLGEFEQGRPVLEEFKKLHPEYRILLTFFSPSGYEIRKNYPLADVICYLPMDTPERARKFVSAVQPNIVVFVKYEFWPNILKEIKKSGAKLIGISMIFRESQVFFKPYGGSFQSILKTFDYLFVQNENSGELLKSIGYPNWAVVGDTRFDRVKSTAEEAEEVPGIKRFKSTHKLMVVGSSWPEDMQVLTPFILQHTEMKFIIAPHEIKDAQIQEYTKNLNAGRYSNYGNSESNDVLFLKNVWIIDSIGLLSKLYKYADYAFVGGGYKTGLHNILEPVVFNIPVFFGDKKYKNFQEAIDLLDLKVAFTVNDNLEEVFNSLDFDEISKRAKMYVAKNVGATKKIMAYLNTIT